MERDFEARWREMVGETSRVSHVAYWNARAEDYDDFIRTSRFAYGHEMAERFEREGLLGPETSVLEIASGVGAVTLPLAARSGRVLAVEPAADMAARLADNARMAGLSNIEVRQASLEEVMTDIAPRSFDLVVMCHASWQFPDIAGVMAFMDRTCRRAACLADTAGRDDAAHGEMYEALGIADHGQDRFPYLFNILYQRGYRPNVSMIDHEMRRSGESARTMWRLLLGKYRQPSAGDLALIDGHVATRSRGGEYRALSTMAAMWWRPRGDAGPA